MTRQASNSFLIKGWALTIATAAYGYAASKSSWPVALIGVLACLGFWYLDAFFLRQERLFRCLYRAAVVPAGSVTVFSMDTSAYRSGPESQWRSVMLAPSVSALFGGLAVTGLFLAATSALTQPASACRTAAATASSSASGVPGTSGQKSPSASPSHLGSRCT